MLLTKRLLLRQWQPDDVEPFAHLNADTEVTSHFPAPLTRQQSDEILEWQQQQIAEQGWGFWAVARRDTSAFIGFVGLNAPEFAAHFTPCVEIGWRLQRDALGQGFATEAARACLQYGFEQLQLNEIVSFTSHTNLRSQLVMQRLGMRHRTEDDFLHPMLSAEHRLAAHVLYRLSAAEWRQQRLN